MFGVGGGPGGPFLDPRIANLNASKQEQLAATPPTGLAPGTFSLEDITRSLIFSSAAQCRFDEIHPEISAIGWRWKEKKRPVYDRHVDKFTAGLLGLG